MSLISLKMLYICPFIKFLQKGSGKFRARPFLRPVISLGGFLPEPKTSPENLLPAVNRRSLTGTRRDKIFDGLSFSKSCPVWGQDFRRKISSTNLLPRPRDRHLLCTVTAPCKYMMCIVCARVRRIQRTCPLPDLSSGAGVREKRVVCERSDSRDTVGSDARSLLALRPRGLHTRLGYAMYAHE